MESLQLRVTITHRRHIKRLVAQVKPQNRVEARLPITSSHGDRATRGKPNTRHHNGKWRPLAWNWHHCLPRVTFLRLSRPQVWFQNRRSKERRMKQLNALGARRHFFRNPRRMRGLRPGEELGDNPELLGQPGFNYFGKFINLLYI